MICKFCGNSIEDNSDFCFICGQKVENAEPVAQSNDVFSQSSAPAEAPVAEVPVAPAYVVEAPAAPAAPVAPAAPIPAAYASCPYVTTESPCVANAPAPAKGKKGKKAKKEKDPSKASKGLKFFTALFLALFLAVPAFLWKAISLAFVVLLVVYAVLDSKAYKKAKAAGYEEKAVAILNSTGIGACIGFVLVCVKFLMVAYM